MKKLISILLSLTLVFLLASCENTAKTETGENAAASAEETYSVPDAAVDESISAEEATGSFELTTEDGAFTRSGSVYTITAAGTYTASGLLEGQIIVEAGADDEVILELQGATIISSSDSPIKALSAGKLEISAKKDTENVVRDERSAKTTDSDTQGVGAIYAKCDLKLKGNGTLVVAATYNNGIHTTKDLTIQNLTLKVTAKNNAIKGNDSITVKSGTVVAISTGGDGVKTENTDQNKNGVTRGDITLSGGAITVYAAGDGFQAAHNFVTTAGEDGSAPNVTIYTGSYSSYTASDSDATSYKGVKVQNELNIEAGSITIQSYDDGLHADYGTVFEDGTKGQGTINVSGGSITINVYSPDTKTAGGQMGPGFGKKGGGFGGFGSQQSVSGADGIHADYVLNVSGGVIRVDSAYEGLEANVINVSGGTAIVSANDDGVNATKGVSTPLVNVTGGVLDVSVPTSGDTDGIDSNGLYVQTGGLVITRGPNNQNMAAIDADSSVSITGGTLIVLGYGRVSTGGSVKSYSVSLHAAGSHTVTAGGVSYTFTNASAYSSTACYSDVAVTA